MSSSNYGIVPRDDGAQVLLVRSGDTWSLPTYVATQPHDIAVELRETLGVDVVVLGTVRESAGPGGWSLVSALELRGDVRGQGAARWAGCADLDRSVEPMSREVLDEWFAAGSTAADPLPAVAWTREGWFDEAVCWMTERLVAADRRPTGPAEQFITSPWSCILRMPAGEGFAYLKAAPEVFGHEPELTAKLAEWFPDAIVPVVAVDASRRWLLSTDIGPCWEIDPVTTPDLVPVYASAIERYGDIQKKTLDHLGTLEGLGVPDRRPTALPALFEEVLADTSALMVGEEGGISAADHEKLRAFVPAFRDMCEGLAGFNFPETLVNFDFWHGNISFRDNGGDVIFDWAESGIGHPMFSLATVTREFEVHDLPGGDGMRDSLVGTYLAQWREFESEERIREAYRLARPGGILCRAQSWRDSLSTLTEPKRYRKHRRAVAVNIARMLPLI